MALIGLGLAFLVATRRRLPRISLRRRTEAHVDVLMVARLLALSVASGYPLARGFVEISTRVAEPERAAINDILGRARRDGLTRALVETTGPLDGLAERMAKAQVTGAPVGPALDAFISTTHDARRFQAVEEARTIGVKLIVPLTLLLLPGFLALVVAPFVLEQLDGLLGAALP
jgi:tight adherence protein B